MTQPRPHILIITANSPVSDLVSFLTAAGYEVSARTFEAGRIEGLQRRDFKAIICHFPDALPHSFSKMLVKLRSAYGQAVPVIGCLPQTITASNAEPYDTVMLAPNHPAQVQMRLKAIARAQTMQAEIERRLATAKETFSIAPPVANDAPPPPLRILFVGRPTPDFMTIINALQDAQIEVVAAFTSFTAFDYLHSEDFDAVVLNALESAEPAYTISATMRRNSKLYHTPTLILATDNGTVDLDSAIAKGASDIVMTGAPMEEISGRILELAGQHRGHKSLKAKFSIMGGRDCMDAETGLFNRRFFDAHLARMCGAISQDGQAASVCLINIDQKDATISAEETESAQPKIGSMLRSLVRMEDCAARLSAHQFAVLFPDQTDTEAQIAAERIRAIIEATGFDGEGRTFTVSASAQVLQIKPWHTAQDILAKLDMQLAVSTPTETHLAI